MLLFIEFLNTKRVCVYMISIKITWMCFFLERLLTALHFIDLLFVFSPSLSLSVFFFYQIGMPMHNCFVSAVAAKDFHWKHIASGFKPKESKSYQENVESSKENNENLCSIFMLIVCKTKECMNEWMFWHGIRLWCFLTFGLITKVAIFLG